MKTSKKNVLSLVLCTVLCITCITGYTANAKAYSTANTFRIGIQMSDRRPGSNCGIEVKTNWVTSTSTLTYSEWCRDSNAFDPDYVRLSLERFPSMNLPQNMDVRIGIQLWDHSGNPGIRRFTPWASENGGWSDWAFDSNQYDPDYARVFVQTRYKNGFNINDLKIGIQLADGGGKITGKGTSQFTNWLSDLDPSNGYHSFSNWAGDSNGFDPDSMRINLTVK